MAEAALRMYLLGGFRAVRASDGVESEIVVSSKKAKGLLAYLALNRIGAVSREKLAALLWEDRGEAQARQSLRQCIAVLRREIQNGGPELLLTPGEGVSLRKDLVWSDLRAFEADAAGDLEALRRAAIAYAGEFLSGLNVEGEEFENWIMHERSRLRELACDVLLRVSLAEEKEGHGDHAIAAVQRLVELDPLSEDYHRRLIALLARHRGRAAALRQYEFLVALLRREVDVAPEPATAALLKEIQKLPESALDLRPAASVDNEPLRPPLLTERQFLRRRRFRLPLLAAAGTGAIAVVTTFVLGWPPAVVTPTGPPPAINDGRQDPTPPLTGRISIAVLPFVSHGPGGQAEVLATALTDELTADLSRYPATDVVSRRTAAIFKGHALDVREIGRRLGTTYIVEGSVRPAEGKLRVNVQLIDATTGVLVWTDRFERDQAERLATQNEILARLARSLHNEATLAESARARQLAPASTAINDLLMHAWSAALLAPHAEARAQFEEVLRLYPNSASAREGIAFMHALEVIDLTARDPAHQLEIADRLIDEAKQRRPTSGRVHYVRGVVFRAQGRYEEALGALEHALSLNHGRATAYSAMAAVKMRLGRTEEGLADVEKAIRINSADRIVPTWMTTAGFGHLLLGNDDVAVDYFRRATDAKPDYHMAWAWLASAEALRGNTAAARAAVREFRRHQPDIEIERLARPHASDSTIYMEQVRRVHDAIHRMVTDGAALTAR